MALIRQVTADLVRVRGWCRDFYPDDPLSADRLADLTLTRLLSRVGVLNTTNHSTWIYLTTINFCLHRQPCVTRTEDFRKTKTDTAPAPIDLPWQQALHIINGLEEVERLAVKLRDLVGLATEEIASITRQALEQVRAQVSEGRRNFLIKWSRLRRPVENGVGACATEEECRKTEEDLRLLIPYLRAQIKECPDELTLLGFLEGNLAPAEMAGLNLHVMVCGLCDLVLHRAADFERQEAASELGRRPTAESAGSAGKEETRALAAGQSAAGFSAAVGGRSIADPRRPNLTAAPNKVPTMSKEKENPMRAARTDADEVMYPRALSAGAPETRPFLAFEELPVMRWRKRKRAKQSFVNWSICWILAAAVLYLAALLLRSCNL